MAHFHDNALIGASGQGGYQIERSLRFNSADSAYLNRTYSGACLDAKLMTISVWVKRGKLTTAGQQPIFSSYSAVRFGGDLTWTAADKIQFRPGGNGDGASNQYSISTDAVFRDPSAWYHIVIQYDSTQATSTNRQKIYVNGVQQTVTGNYPTQNYLHTYAFNNANNQIGAYTSYGTDYLDSYLTEFHFIDGQALTPSSFGETDTITGVWKPKKYSGSGYGTNGFYLNFKDNSSVAASTLGKDYSGNGNNWTPSATFSVTPGAGNDSLIDTPTPYADGGNGRGNYCTLNPLDTNSSVTLSNGNLNFYAPASSVSSRATFGITSGKWYWEVQNPSLAMIGIMKSGASLANYVGADANGWGYYYFNGNKYTNGSATSYGNSYTNTNVIGIAFDADNGKLYFSKDNTWQASGDPAAGTNAAFTGLTFGPYFPALGNTSQSCDINFGQRSFSYTPPAGFKALNTQNLPEPSIKKPSSYFDAKLYTGTGGSQSITGLGFSPDLVWIKSRSLAYAHNLGDTVRGVNNTLSSNSTGAENYAGSGDITAFNSDGFSIRQTSNWEISTNGATYVAWCWDESATPGFDIVTYTGDGTTSANRLIDHSLGVKPDFVVTKKRSGGTDYGWSCWHKDLGGNYGIWLDKTSARNINMWAGYSNFSATKFTPPDLSYGNESGATYVNYLWSEVAGFSKFGSYTGNGSTDGTFVFCGFRPALILMKRTDSAGESWSMWDNRRIGYNAAQYYLAANSASTEDSTAPGVNSNGGPDFLSNGFKMRSYNGSSNNSGGTYIFAAFAESPQKYSLAR